jgi:hypothetical protein
MLNSNIKIKSNLACDDLPSEGISITTDKIYPRGTPGGEAHFKSGQTRNIKSREVSEWNSKFSDARGGGTRFRYPPKQHHFKLMTFLMQKA